MIIDDIPKDIGTEIMSNEMVEGLRQIRRPILETNYDRIVMPNFSCHLLYSSKCLHISC